MRTDLLMCVVVATAAACAGTQAPPASQVQDLSINNIQAANDRDVMKLLTSIAGKENDSAGVVFQNVHYLAAVPAKTLLSIMNGGYAKALGVRCTHCHVPSDYSLDTKRPKRAAREMQQMHRMINGQLRTMEHIATPPTENRAINCMMCHRGKADPRQ
jgi:hypothetical protein